MTGAAEGGRRPVVWSLAGLDSGGGAGLSADQRAADAAGVHLCPVAAALTAQNSVAVAAVFPVPAAQFAAQLDALADDLPPDAIKTGLLGSVENLRVLADRLDRWRARRPVPLVVDPVLGASTGASFADDAMRRAMCELLLPRATLVTPNRAEAARLVASPAAGDDRRDVPRLAQALRSMGAAAACLTGGDARGDGPVVRDWVDAGDASLPARGWLCGPRIDTDATHGTGCTFATAAAAALARGFPVADALVLARMLVASGLHPGAHGPGAGAGPLRPDAGFIRRPALVPWVLDPEAPEDDAPRALAPPAGVPAAAVEGVYGIAADGPAAASLCLAGVRTVQLRLKRREGEGDGDWHDRLRADIAIAQTAARRAGATLVVNDHWEEAVAAGVGFVHLGQEDLAALDAPSRRRLAEARHRGLRLGISSHSPWELARARAWRPDYVACGPVWPTLTKAMPWRSQGEANLRWWVAVAGTPVVAIGGITGVDRLREAARCGASSVALARALVDAGPADVARWRLAWEGERPGAMAGEEGACPAAPGEDDGWPRPSL